MLQNNNKKFINILSENCLRANKIRNMIAVFAIVLTTVLFTSVATVLEGFTQTVKEQQIRQSGTKFMMSVKYLTEEESEKFIGNPSFSDIGMMRHLGTAQNEELRKIQVNLSWADKSFMEGAFVELVKGNMPEGEDEILVDTVVLKMMGLPERTGQEIPFTYEVNGELRERRLSVAGIYRGDASETVSTVYLSKILLERELAGVAMPEHDMAGAGSIVLHVSFPSDKNLDESRRKVLQDAGFDPDAARGEDGFVSSNLNGAYVQFGVDGSVLAGGVLLVLVIMLAGYLIISNVFRISVLKDMRMYGQLKTIGTSPKQLRRLLKRQADLLSIIGISAGLCLGYVMGRLLLPVVMTISRFADVQNVKLNPWVFAASAVFAYATVWISCRRPAKMMSKMSPIQALRYQGKVTGGREKARGRESRARILQMAFSNVIDNKGKTFLVVLSLSLSVILFNSILNFTDGFDKKTYVDGQSAADFVVSNVSLESRGESKSYVIPKEFLEEADKRDDIEKNGASYCYQAEDDEREAAGNEYDGIMTAKVLTVNDEPYPKEYAMEKGKLLFGFDRNLFERCRVAAGTLDREKLKSGRYIVEATTFVNNDTDYDAATFTLKPGDRVTAELGGDLLEYEVLANVVVHYDMLYPGSVGEGSVFILPSEEYLNRFPEELPLRYIMDAKEGKFEEVDAFLKEYEESPQSNIKYKSVTMVEEEFRAYKRTFSTTGTVLAIIFGAIGILNLLNVTLTNAVARQREFAVMQSIGMTRRQLRRLFVLEGVMYAGIAGVVSLILSGLFSLTAVKAIAGGYWFCNYHFTILPACALTPLYIIVSGLIALAVDRLWNNGSVVERLRRSK